MKINTDFIASIQIHLQQLRRLHAKSIRGKPWFILLGPSRAGKSSFLRHAELAVQHILTPDDPVIQTWICENALYLDIQTKTISSEQLQHTWEAIAELVHTNKGRLRQGGLILVLPIHDLMNQTKLQRDVLINDYKTIALQFAHAITKKPLAIYTIFSQCDRIAGFCEYFNDLDRTQRQSPCGFILHSKGHPHAANFADEFDQLLKNFHETLIHRLHRVHNPQERARINDFALQFESIKDIITDAITQLNGDEENIENRGCFFVSNLQDGAIDDRISKSLEHTFTLKAVNVPPVTFNAQAYFTHQIATRIIPSHRTNTSQSTTTHSWARSIGTHAVTLGLCGGIALALTVSFLHERALIQESELQLGLYQATKPNLGSKLSTAELRSLIESLTLLQTTETKIKRSHHWPNLFPLSRARKVTDAFEEVYKQELSQELYNRFASFLDHTLTATSDDDADGIYSALKAYLMLGSSEHRQSDYLITWLSHQLDISEFKDKLAPMLTDNGIQVTLNPDTINEARSYLAGLPEGTLGILILKSQSELVTADKIPVIFTKEGYKNTVKNQIPAIAKNLFGGDWVLGQTTTATKEMTEEALTAELRKQYPAEYVKWWQQFLVSVNLPPINNLEEAISALQKITDAQAHLVTMIEHMREQTSPMTGTDAISVQFNKEINNQFAHFDAGSYQHLSSLNNNFKQLYSALQEIAKSPDQNAAALHFAKEVFSHDSHNGMANLVQQSEHLPSPLNLWVAEVVDACWQAVLPKAKLQIETLWHEQVAGEYLRDIEGRYPVAVHGKSELPLSDFNHFFAHNGTLDLFVNRYLKEFINTDSPTWKTKQVGVLDFPLDPELLETLVRAKLIRQMFFPNQSTETHIGFQLTPLRLDPIIKDLVMDIDGQSVFAYPGSAKSMHLTWPGAHGQINLVVNNIDGSKSFVTETGPWAWFKLLSKVDVKRMESPQKFQVTFNLNGNAARYELTADTVVNPYLANIVSGFNLPSTLFLRDTETTT